MRKSIMILGVHHLYTPNNGDIYKFNSGNIKSDYDRILLIIGAAHVHLLKQFFNENGEYHVENTIKYLI